MEMVIGIILATVITAAFLLRVKKQKLPPGPIPVPIFGNLLQLGTALNHRNLAEYSKKFGEIFHLRLGQKNVVVISSPKLAKESLYKKGAEFGSRYRSVVHDIFTGKGQDLVFAEYGPHWRRMRRIATLPLFTKRAVEEHRHEWEAEAAAIVEDIKRNPDSSTAGIVIRRYIQLLVYNVTYRMLFDRRFESVEDPLFLKLEMVDRPRGTLPQSFEFNYGDYIPFFRPFLRRFLNICRNAKQERDQVFKFFIEERKKLLRSSNDGDGEKLKCAMDYVLEAEKNGEINEDNVLFMVDSLNAGATVSIISTMEWGIAELVNHPEIQKKVREEIDRELGSGVQVTEGDLEKLPYLRAVIKETLRLRMVFTFLAPRMNVHEAELDGYHIPAGSKIMVNTWWLANDPSHWKNPHEFRPERFLEEELLVEPLGNNFRYLPFGSGRRMCPGFVLALPIMGISLGRLVQNFELLPPPGKAKIDVSERKGQFTLKMLNHSTVVLRPITS